MAIYFALFFLLAPRFTFMIFICLFIRIFNPLQFALHTNHIEILLHILCLFCSISIVSSVFWSDFVYNLNEICVLLFFCMEIMLLPPLCVCIRLSSTKFTRLPFSCHRSHAMNIICTNFNGFGQAWRICNELMQHVKHFQRIRNGNALFAPAFCLLHRISLVVYLAGCWNEMEMFNWIDWLFCVCLCVKQ